MLRLSSTCDPWTRWVTGPQASASCGQASTRAATSPTSSTSGSYNGRRTVSSRTRGVGGCVAHLRGVPARARRARLPARRAAAARARAGRRWRASHGRAGGHPRPLHGGGPRHDAHARGAARSHRRLPALQARPAPHAPRVRRRQPARAPRVRGRGAGPRRGPAGRALRRARRPAPDRDHHQGHAARAQRRLHRERHQVPAAGEPQPRAGRGGELRALPPPSARADLPRGDRGARQVRGPDAAPDEGADHAAPRALVRLPRHQAHADLPSRLPAAQPGRQAPGVGGHPEGHAGARPCGRAYVSSAAALIALLLAPAPVRAETPASPAALARIVVDGTINPAVTSFVHESIARAHDEGAPALVIQLDTPGGLLPSMQAIVKDILAAPLPVIVYVAPSGAGAGSAGVFITLAAHVAAMAPGTNIGAAHPVGGAGEDIKGVMGEKLENFTASFSEAIAQRRGRNVEWAARAVRESVSITSDEAAKTAVVDFVAHDLDEVVALADGRWVEVVGENLKLALGKAVRGADGHVRVHTYEMRLSQRVLNVIADPRIASLLMMAGLLGLYLEFTHPGLAFPGVAGAICLLLALAALHVLPVNTSALALLLLGVALLVTEAFLPTFGVVGAGGLVAFVLGALFLFDAAETGVVVPKGLVFGVSGAVAGIMLVVATLVARSQRARASQGAEGMVGAVGVARGRLAPVGPVVVRGEYWTAESDEIVDAGERVEVTAMDGLRLRVRRARPAGR